MIVGIIRRKPVLTHASIVCEGMLVSVNSVNSVTVNTGVILDSREHSTGSTYHKHKTYNRAR